MNIRQAAVHSCGAEGEFIMMQAHEVQDGGVDVVARIDSGGRLCTHRLQIGTGAGCGVTNGACILPFQGFMMGMITNFQSAAGISNRWFRDTDLAAFFQDDFPFGQHDRIGRERRR